MKGDDIFEMDAVLGELGLDDRPSPKKKNDLLNTKKTSKEKDAILDTPFQFNDSQLTKPRRKNSSSFLDDDAEDFGNYVPSTKREINTQRRSRFKLDSSNANGVQDSNRKKRENSFTFEWDLPDKQKVNEPTKSTASFKDALPLSSDIRNNGEKEKSQEIKLQFLQKDIIAPTVVKDDDKRVLANLSKIKDDRRPDVNFEELLNKFEDKLKTSLEHQLTKSVELSFKKETEEVKSSFANEIRRVNEILDARLVQERLKQDEDHAQTDAHLQSMSTKLVHMQEKLNSYQANMNDKTEIHNRSEEMTAMLRDECSKIKQLVNKTINTIEAEKQSQSKIHTETIEKFASKMVRIQQQQMEQITNNINFLINSKKQNQVDPAYAQWRQDVEQKLSFEKQLNEEKIKANQQFIAALRYQSNFLAESETSLREASLVSSHRVLNFESSKRDLNLERLKFNEEKRSLSRLANEMKKRSEQLENMCHTIIRMRDDGIAAVVQLSKEINSIKTIQETQNGSKGICIPGHACSACREILKSTNKTDFSFNHDLTSKTVPTKRPGIREWWRQMTNNDRIALELEDLYLKQLRKL